VNCAEYRERWLDGQIAEGDADQRDLTEAFAQHRAACSSCVVWDERQRTLDLALGAALVVDPPADLAARLAELPALSSATVLRPVREATANGSGVLGTVLEVVFLVAVGLSVIGVSGVAITDLVDVVAARLGDVLESISLLAASPLIPYVQSLMLTMVEALATLTLVALGVLQINPEVFRVRAGPRSSAQ
jgi:hypothetical protein